MPPYLVSSAVVALSMVSKHTNLKNFISVIINSQKKKIPIGRFHLHGLNTFLSIVINKLKIPVMRNGLHRKNLKL
jgi:hypothetical protein